MKLGEPGEMPKKQFYLHIVFVFSVLTLSWVMLGT